MSWRKFLICDSCTKILPETQEVKFRTGYCHTCEECQLKEWGFFMGDNKVEDCLNQPHEQ